MKIKLSRDFILDQLPALERSFFGDLTTGTIFSDDSGYRFIKISADFNYSNANLNALLISDGEIINQYYLFRERSKVWASSSICEYKTVSVGDVVIQNNTIGLIIPETNGGLSFFNLFDLSAKIICPSFQAYVTKSALSLG